MRELGAGSPQLHRDVGRDLAHRKIALVLTVGPGAEVIGEGAAAAGVAPGCIEHVPTIEEATTRLRTIRRAGDGVWIKGSRALRRERTVEGLGRTGSSERSRPRFCRRPSRNGSPGGGPR